MFCLPDVSKKLIEVLGLLGISLRGLRGTRNSGHGLWITLKFPNVDWGMQGF
jgi:hypothetical protein